MPSAEAPTLDALKQWVAQGPRIAPLLTDLMAGIQTAFPGARAVVSTYLPQQGSLKTLVAGPGGGPLASALGTVEVHGDRRACGPALRRASPWIANDVDVDPFWEADRAVVVRHGVRACWSWRLGPADEPLGTLELFWRAPREPSTDEAASGGDWADLATQMLDRLRDERYRDHGDQRFDKLFRELEDGMCVIEVLFDEDDRAVDYRFLETNAAFEHQTGLQHAVGHTARELVPDLDESWFEVYGEIARTGVPRRFSNDEVAMGRSFDVSAFRFGDPTARQVAVVFRDVTEQLRAEARWRAAEADRRDVAERLTFTLANMSDGFYLVDASWRIVFANAVAERLLERRRDELIGHDLWTVFPGLLGTELEQGYRTVHEEARPVRVEFYFPPLDHWFEVNAHPAEGGVAAFFQVIDERKQAEADLRASEERFRLVARSAADLVWDWDLIRKVLWRGWTGQPVSESPAPDVASWARRIVASERAEVAASLQAALDGGAATWEGTYHLALGDGRVREVANACAIVRDGTGTPVRVVGSLVDVTERNTNEERQARARRLEAVGQLTGGVAHDFNNLLTVVLGTTDMLADRVKDQPSLAAMTGMIRKAAERGAELTRTLLAFARKQPLNPQPTDVATQLRDLLPLLTRTLGEDVEIDLVDGPECPPALIDPTGLEQSILNLILNARDAMPEGGRVVVEVDPTELSEAYAADHDEVVAGPYVRVAVTDTGHGMPASVLARAFDPFFTTKPPGQGTGLGLSSVFGFVKQSGGHIQVYSEEGHGTAVRLYLPVANEAATTWRRPADGIEPRGTDTILVVEDDDLVRVHAAGQLQALGYEVLLASDGPSAMALVDARDDVCLLFTDVVMPGGMTGRELANAARARRPGLRVLYTSGYTENAIVHHGRLDAGVRLLTKPYDRGALARAVRAALDDA